jgi:ribosomal protein L35
MPVAHYSKIKGGIKKRFEVKPSGMIVRKQSGKRHLNMTSGREVINRLGPSKALTAPGHMKRYQRIMNVSTLR